MNDIKVKISYSDLKEIQQYENVSLGQFLGSAFESARMACVSFKLVGRALKKLAKTTWKARKEMRKFGISMKYNSNRSNKMKLFMRKYYPHRDFERNCKHKMPMQDSLSCRKRKDGTMIGDDWCLTECKHCVDLGENRKGELWIKCNKLKEALGK